MAFDLNKNDGSGKGLSDNGSQASSKFDLSKGEEAVVTGGTPKSKIWIIGLIGILILGGGILYYSSGKKTVVGTGGTLTEVAASDLSTLDSSAGVGVKTKAHADVVVLDTTSASNTSAAVVPTDGTVSAKTDPGNENAAILNHKIPATFGQGSASFRRIDQSLIRRIVSYLAKNPGASINVNGYASSDGSLAINQTISQARADAFKKYLISKNVAENRVAAVGKGIENPIASNDSNAGRKKNRRVEIILP